MHYGYSCRLEAEKSEELVMEYTDNDESECSRISESEVDTADPRELDGPGPHQNGETLIVSDAESDYSGISNEDDEDCEDDFDDEIEFSTKEEEVLLTPKEEEAFDDDETILAEEVRPGYLLPVKEEIFSDASDVDFAGFDEPITNGGPAKQEEGLSDAASLTDREADEVGDEDDEWVPSPASVKSELFQEESSHSSMLGRIDDDDDSLPFQATGNMDSTKDGTCFYGSSSPLNPSNAVSRLRCVPIKSLVGKPRKKQTKNRSRHFGRVYHCYYCPVFFKNRFYLPAHVLNHLTRGDPKFEVTDPKSGNRVHPAYLEETQKRSSKSKGNQKNTLPNDKPYKCHLCDFKTKHIGVLRSHLKLKAKQALEPKRFSCFYCGWTAGKKLQLRQHMRGHIVGSFKCEYCAHRAHTASMLEAHLRTHTGDKPYSCDICGEQFTKLFSQRRHMLSHKPVPLHCLNCDFVAANGKILDDHIEDHLSSNDYGCPMCNFGTVDTTTLRSHMRSSHGMKLEKLKCRWCDFEADRCTSLNIHERSHFTPHGYACEECAYTTDKKGQLKLHMWTHTGQKPYACELCDYRSASRKCVTRHMITHVDGPSYRSFACSHCDKTFKTKQTCQLHEKYVHKLVEKEFGCRYCDYKSHLKSTVIQHESIHTGEKSFACSLCDYVGRVKGNLISHMRTHSRGGEHKCDYCNFTSVHSTGISTHMQVTHPTAKPYKCMYCSSTFRLKPELIDHEREHTGDKKRPRRKGLVYKKLKCRMCPFETIPFKNLKSHYELYHPEQNLESIPEFVERKKQEMVTINQKPKTKRHCRFCNFVSTVRRTVRVHENTHLLQMMGQVQENMNLCDE